jgi:hypothetical protein
LEHESKPAYCGNVLIENRNGLVVDTELVIASGTAERDGALQMAQRIDGKRVLIERRDRICRTDRARLLAELH